MSDIEIVVHSVIIGMLMGIIRWLYDITKELNK